MKQRTLVGLALIVAGAAIVSGIGAARRERARWDGDDWPDRDWVHDGTSNETEEVESAPVLVIRGALDVVNLTASDGPRIGVTASGNGLGDALQVRRADDGSKVVFNLRPRRRVDIAVPRGTAVRLRFAKSRGTVEGLDDIDVRCAKARFDLRDVAGTVRVRSAKSAIDVQLANDRETGAVDVAIAKVRFSLGLPASRGGVYDVRAAKSRVSSPASVEGGIPVRVRAAVSRVSISAA
jgi:hypothetical protein